MMQKREESTSVEAGSRGSIIAETKAYVSDSVQELKRVAYPTRAEATQATIATLVIISFVSLCLFILDLLFGRAMGAILG